MIGEIKIENTEVQDKRNEIDMIDMRGCAYYSKIVCKGSAIISVFTRGYASTLE